MKDTGSTPHHHSAVCYHENMRFSKDLTNKEIAALFQQVTSVYEIQKKDLFHIRAYQHAASGIEQTTTSLKELWKEGKLDQVPGIGEKFTRYLDELFRTGTMRHFVTVLKTEPEGMYPLLDVPGVGPKTAHSIAVSLHLTKATTAVKTFMSALRSGKIRNVPGFSEKKEEQLLRDLSREEKHSNRMLVHTAEQIAEDVLQFLRRSPDVLLCEALGSVRRRASTVGDIDIAVSTHNAEQVLKHLKSFPHMKKLISSGEKMAMFVHDSGEQVDIRFQHPKAWGSLLQHYTGSKFHNIKLRTLALEKKLSLSEYGIKKGKQLIELPDEVSLYTYLGLSYIQPELREDTGEIEAAQKHALPSLVELKNIRGDFHIHTNLSYPSSHDLGESSIADILTKAQQFGYDYIGLSDHHPKQSGLTDSERIEAVKKHMHSIDQHVTSFTKTANKSIPHVFKGLEVDIHPDGTLAVSDELLELLDYAIVSIHSQFGLTSKQQTERIMRGLSHKKAIILGHPTGRDLQVRSEMDCDWKEIFAFCAKNHKLIEINASPQRLDLPDALVKQAVEAGVMFIINTDAHHVNHMGFMKYGVWTARRGWAEAKNIANTNTMMNVKRLLR